MPARPDQELHAAPFGPTRELCALLLERLDRPNSETDFGSYFFERNRSDLFRSFHGRTARRGRKRTEVLKDRHIGGVGVFRVTSLLLGLPLASFTTERLWGNG